VLELSYEIEPLIVERFVERVVRVGGYVSRFKVYETIHRLIVTRILSELVSPDGRVLTSFYVDTRFVETEYTVGRTTKFLGIERLVELQLGAPVAPPGVVTPPVIMPPEQSGQPSTPITPPGTVTPLVIRLPGRTPQPPKEEMPRRPSVLVPS